MYRGEQDSNDQSAGELSNVEATSNHHSSETKFSHLEEFQRMQQQMETDKEQEVALNGQPSTEQSVVSDHAEEQTPQDTVQTDTEGKQILSYQYYLTLHGASLLPYNYIPWGFYLFDAMLDFSESTNKTLLI